MSLGLIVSILVTFILLPTLINIFSTDNEINVKSSEKSKITEVLAAIAKKSKVFYLELLF